MDSPATLYDFWMFRIRQGVEGRKIFADLLKKAIDRFDERFLPKAT